MLHLPQKPLIACTTSEQIFSNRIEAVAAEIGTDFWSSDNWGKTLEKCSNRQASCMVVDYENSNEFTNPIASKKLRDSLSLIVVIPQGNIRAAFQAASAGAINVIERPIISDELAINLKTAIASESRMAELLQSEKRFTSPFFDCLSKREKTILALLLGGDSNKHIASHLELSLRTVEGDRAQIIKKLHANSLVELIKLVTSIEKDPHEIRKKIFGNMLPSMPLSKIS